MEVLDGFPLKFSTRKFHFTLNKFSWIFSLSLVETYFSVWSEMRENEKRSQAMHTEWSLVENCLPQDFHLACCIIIKNECIWGRSKFPKRFNVIYLLNFELGFDRKFYCFSKFLVTQISSNKIFITEELPLKRISPFEECHWPQNELLIERGQEFFKV